LKLEKENMSNLTVSSNDALLQLAQELNIELGGSNTNFYEPDIASKTTNFIRPKNIRGIFDAHKLDGVIKWSPVEKDMNAAQREEEYLFLPDENGGEPREINNVVEIRGIIMNYQQRDELRYFDGEKTNILCSVIGYQENSQIVKKLPEVAYGLKHQFEKDASSGKWFVNTNKANPVVDKLGLVGYRGEKVTNCADCIRCGLSTEVIPGIGEGGSDKKITCEARGRLYVAVFEVLVKRKTKASVVKGKDNADDNLVCYPVSSLVDADGNAFGNFIFVEVPLSKSSIQGKYVKNAQGKKDEDASINGYESFCRGLTIMFKDERDPLRNPIFHNVKLTYKKASPTATISQADFASLGVVDIDKFKAAQQEWQVVIPQTSVETLEVESLNKPELDGTINVKSEVTPMKNITVSSTFDDQEFPF
jgi:hypothetical protein